MQDTSDTRSSNKQMKIDYARFSKELKACQAHADREHDTCKYMAVHTHELALSEEKTRQLELEIWLEEMKMRHLAMQHGLGDAEEAA